MESLAVITVVLTMIGNIKMVAPERPADLDGLSFDVVKIVPDDRYFAAASTSRGGNTCDFVLVVSVGHHVSIFRVKTLVHGNDRSIFVSLKKVWSELYLDFLRGENQ
jgi:hypothetical protein